MKTILIVVKDFGDYKRGARIEDPATIEQLKVAHPNRVVLAKVPDSSVFLKDAQ